MKTSVDLLISISDLFDKLGGQEKPLDELSRKILLQVAHSRVDKRPIKVTDVAQMIKDTSHPTLYGRLRALAAMGLLAETSSPEDGRVTLLSLTPKAQSQLRSIAREIVRASRAYAPNKPL